MAAKKNQKKHRRLRAVNKRNKKRHEDYVELIKKVPVHTRERLKRKIKRQNETGKKVKKGDDCVEFIKQVSLHPRNRLRKQQKRKKGR